MAECKKKNAWVVLCAVTPFINVAMKVCNIKRKIRIGLYPTWYFMRGFGQKKFGIWQKKEIKRTILYIPETVIIFSSSRRNVFRKRWRGEVFTTTIFFAKFPQLLLLTDPVLHFSDSYIWIMTVQSYKPLEKSALKVFYIYDGIFPQENKLAFTKHNAVLHRGN